MRAAATHLRQHLHHHLHPGPHSRRPLYRAIRPGPCATQCPQPQHGNWLVLYGSNLPGEAVISAV